MSVGRRTRYSAFRKIALIYAVLAGFVQAIVAPVLMTTLSRIFRVLRRVLCSLAEPEQMVLAWHRVAM